MTPISFSAIVRERFQNNLHRILGFSNDTSGHSPFADANLYLLQSPGKLVRPSLCYAAALAVGLRELEPADCPAWSLELIHTYSLIHDDLPAMDDDNIRRGKPSVHRKFDEATAILVGDNLLTRAFELISEAQHISDSQKVGIVDALSKASGSQGMVGGQFIDIQSSGTILSWEQLEKMHVLKTGKLISASVKTGGIVAGASEIELSRLESFGESIGLAFQIVDDILDVEGTQASIGKTPGKDQLANKTTAVSSLGLERAKMKASELIEAAYDSISIFGEDARHLSEIARSILIRTN